MNSELSPNQVFQYLELLPPLFKAIAWPFVFLLIAYGFRKEIQNLIDRIREIGPKVIKLTNNLNQRDASPILSGDDGELKELDGKERTKAMQEVEAIIRNDLKNHDKNKLQDLMIWEIAFRRLDAHFWQVYYYIFDSQIALLKTIKNSGGSIAYSDSSEFLESAKKDNTKLLEWDIEAFLTFLIRNGLASKTDDNRLNITNFGDDFFLFLHRYSLAEKRF